MSISPSPEFHNSLIEIKPRLLKAHKIDLCFYKYFPNAAVPAAPGTTMPAVAQAKHSRETLSPPGQRRRIEELKMNGKLLAGLLFATLALPTKYATAYDTERVKRNLSDDLVHCTVFYQFGVLSAREAKRKDIETAANTSKDNSLALLVALRPQKEEIPKIEADIEVSLRQFAGAIKKDGWPRLILQYGDLCQQLLENPKARIQYWIDK